MMKARTFLCLNNLFLKKMALLRRKHKLFSNILPHPTDQPFLSSANNSYHGDRDETKIQNKVKCISKNQCYLGRNLKVNPVFAAAGYLDTTSEVSLCKLRDEAELLDSKSIISRWLISTMRFDKQVFIPFPRC